MTALRRFVNRIKDTASEKKKESNTHTRVHESSGGKVFEFFRESRQTIRKEARGNEGKISLDPKSKTR